MEKLTIATVTYNSLDYTKFFLDNLRKNAEITPQHVVKITCDNWEDINDQIESDHLTFHERREARKLAYSK